MNELMLSQFKNIKLNTMRKRWKIFFVISGLTATIWFLVRVIPKPSRAYYPCMQAASPYMAAFVIWIITMSASVFSFRNALAGLRKYRYISAALFAIAGLIFAGISITQNRQPVYANSKTILAENISIGEAKGIFPGRVVWVWNNDATNENCTNVFGDGWFMNKNTNLPIADSMTRQAIQQLTGTETVTRAWEELFRFYNSKAGKGDVNYTSEEKIFIKVNNVSASSSTFTTDYTILNTKRYGMAETSPQVVLSVLRQLVNECGISEDKIYVGDPMKHIYKHVYELWHNEFPNIHYIDHKGTYGREKALTDGIPVIFYSDRGKIMITNGDTARSDALYSQLKNADYLINIGALKAHARAGVSLCAKNHFGSHSRASASHLHAGLVSPDKNLLRTGNNLYRVQVDLMGHKMLGGKTLVYILDALWAGSEANDPPRKWSLAPFNNDWTSSVFVSQDPVAIESVGYDFLKAEFTSGNPFGSYPQMPGTNDYIMQAADSAFWPAGIKYDPENDGILLKSLGVCESWNNPVDKQYSRNLKTGNGIEMVFIDQKKLQTSVGHNFYPNESEFKVYPNPATTMITVEFTGIPENRTFSITSIDGKKCQSGEIKSQIQQIDTHNLNPGIYLFRVEGYSKSLKLVKY
jgi:hypothetical protein